MAIPRWNHRITMPRFRASPTRRSRCQAPFCHCTRQAVTNRLEGTLGSLRYPFGGDHPSQTTRHAVSPQKRGLDPRQEKGRISTPAPRPLARADLCLRPILHVPCPGTTRSCSKGSRGLSVPSRVPGIFTGTTISPGSWSRQCPDRYTIRAGRNLPDKEFRYLRTVIVTAAVRPYTSSRDLAQPCVFGKQSPGPFLCGSPKGERPLSRSYRTILPSSLTTTHPCASVCSTRSRVSVCGTVPRAIVLSGFSWG